MNSAAFKTPVALCLLLLGVVAFNAKNGVEPLVVPPPEKISADMRFTDFVARSLTGTDFRGVDLSMSDFRHATLRDVDFTRADLTWVNFVGARMCNVSMPDQSTCDFNCDGMIDLIPPDRTRCPYLAP